MKLTATIIAMLVATGASAEDAMTQMKTCIALQSDPDVTRHCRTSQIPINGPLSRTDSDTAPPVMDGSASITNPTPKMVLDMMNTPPPMMVCYMQSFNERKLCALLGDTPGCVKWLTEHPDPAKDPK